MNAIRMISILLDETRAGLQAQLGARVDSILRELAGRIEISVSRLLADGE